MLSPRPQPPPLPSASPSPYLLPYTPPCCNDRTSGLVSAVERLNKAALWDTQQTMGQQPVSLQRTASSVPVKSTEPPLRRTTSVNTRGSSNSPRGTTSSGGGSGPSSPISLGTIATFEAPGKTNAVADETTAAAPAASQPTVPNCPSADSFIPSLAPSAAPRPVSVSPAAAASAAAPRARAASAPGASVGAAERPAAGESHHPQSDLSRRASRIGLSIHQMMQKLHKLAKLSKRTSMFDDPTAEIQNLTALVSQDMAALGAAITGLQAFCEAQASAKDTAGDSRQPSGGSAVAAAGQAAGSAPADAAARQRVELGMAVVESLRERLAKAGEEFKDVIAARSEALKVSENRRQLFSATAATVQGATAWHSKRPVVGGGEMLLPTTSSSSHSSSLSLSLASSPSGSPTSSPSSTLPIYNPFGRSSNTTTPILPTTTAHTTHSNYTTNYNSTTSNSTSPFCTPSYTSGLLSTASASAQHHAIALEQVESSMGELTAVFRDLANTVAQQGGGGQMKGNGADLAICIDDGLAESLREIQQTHGALLQQLDLVHSHRPLIVKTFLTLVSFLFVFFMLAA